MLESILVFVGSLFLVVKGATLATKYSAKLAQSFHLSKYIVGFVIVAFISILPETLISINSAIQGIPAFGIGTLFGSNVADLSLIFAILIISAGRGLKIQSKVLKDISEYPLFLVVPLVLGFNSYYSRLDAVILILTGLFFYYTVFKQSVDRTVSLDNGTSRIKSVVLLVVAMALLLAGAHFTVLSATKLAGLLGINPILIGMLVVSLGTTMPELFFSLKSVQKNDDGLAIGDVLGSVLADATIVVGIVALIRPFYFPAEIIYLTGLFMLIASIVLVHFMRSERVLSKVEGYLLLAFWVGYVIIEFVVNT